MKSPVIFAMIAMFAAPALGQIPTSSAEIRSNPAKDAQVRGAIELKRLVGCALDRREKLGESIILSRPGSHEEYLVLRPFRKVIENCMNDLVQAIYLGNVEVRGYIAEDLYLKRYSGAPDFSTLEHHEVALPEAWQKGKLDEGDKLLLFGQQFANCVVAADPQSSDELLRTSPRSPEERTVVRKLTGSLGPCLVQGKTLKLDAAWLRAVLAEGLNRSIVEWRPAGLTASAMGN